MVKQCNRCAARRVVCRLDQGGTGWSGNGSCGEPERRLWQSLLVLPPRCCVFLRLRDTNAKVPEAPGKISLTCHIYAEPGFPASDSCWPDAFRPKIGQAETCICGPALGSVAVKCPPFELKMTVVGLPRDRFPGAVAKLRNLITKYISWKLPCAGVPCSDGNSRAENRRNSRRFLSPEALGTWSFKRFENRHKKWCTSARR